MQANRDEKQTYWRVKLQEYRQSRLSRREFCERNQIRKTTLDYWFRRLGKAGASKGLVELKVLSAQAPGSALEVVVAGKYRLAVCNGFDPQLLGQVVKTLESLA
jgi:hypothetical protein